MARTSKPLTLESLQNEVRFLVKTLLRDDLFGNEVGVTEAEKLLESSLSLGFVEYCAFLKRQAFIDIDRGKNTIAVLPRGRALAESGPDATLGPTLANHFAKQLGDGAGAGAAGSDAPSPAAPTPAPPVPAAAPLALPAAPASRAPRPAFGALATPRPFVGAAAGGAAGMGGGRPDTLALLDRERFVRGDVLGQGSLGVVCAARDGTLERDVVVKEARHVYELVTYLQRDEITARIRAAVMAQARLEHPHVLRVVDVQMVGGTPTLILDRAVESLRARMERGPMPVEVVIRVLLQVCYGLVHAHAHGVIHGGLKPENVLFDAQGNARVSDFGIARVTERDPDPNTSAPPVYVGRGNPSYMAPEQLHRFSSRPRDVGPAADVYATGIILYEMLTGQLPGRRSPMPSADPRVGRAVGEAAAAALDDLFDRMTRDPLEERCATVDDVLEAIYAAFPEALVGRRGTLLLSEEDPLPPPAPRGAEDLAVDVDGAGGQAAPGGEDAPPTGQAEVTLVQRNPTLG